ncbi:MAG: type III secretion inner membrane ring lipoprotein SctJ [Pseudomonadota bacterium]
MVRRAALALCVTLALAGCRIDLHSGLTEMEANEIVAVLRLAGVAADRRAEKDGLVTVRVEDADFAQAVEILRAKGYPRKSYANLGDVFEAKGFVSSQTEERARFIFAMSEELSRTISEIDGILSARVHVVLPTNDPLARDTPPSSASVVIRHAADATASRLLPQIKMMVANSIEGLDYGNVSVVFIPVEPRPSVAAMAATPRLSGMAPLPWIAGSGLAILLLGAVLTWRFWPGRGARRGDLVVESAE